jgi:hypothetical protein
MKRFIISEYTAKMAAAKGRTAAIRYSVRKYRKLAERTLSNGIVSNPPIYLNTCPLCILYRNKTEACPLTKALCGEISDYACHDLWHEVFAWRDVSGDRFAIACLTLADKLNSLLPIEDRV